MLLIWLEGTIGTYCFRLYNNDEIFLQNLFNKLKFRILPYPSLSVLYGIMKTFVDEIYFCIRDEIETSGSKETWLLAETFKKNLNQVCGGTCPW